MVEDRPDPASLLAHGRNTAIEALHAALVLHQHATETHERAAELLARLGDPAHADWHRASADRARFWQQRADRLLAQATATDRLLHLDALGDPARRD